MLPDLSALLSTPAKRLATLFICMLLGAVWFVLVRAVLIDASGPHYHANFHVYVDGEREQFAENIFYEEVSSCGSSDNDPLARVHMHDLINDVVHVHDASSTWGNFFENIGFTLGNNVLYARTETNVDGQGGRLTFILNGEEVRSIANKTINSEDTLLVSFGSEDADELTQRYSQIVQSAAEYNEKADPSACSGSQSVNYFERIKLVLGIN